MMFKYFISACVLMIGVNLVFASNESPTIPLSIDDVKTQLINKNLIRIIQYNTEVEPKLVIERLARPRLKVIEKLVIKKVKVGDRNIDFEDTAGVFVESINVIKNNIKFSVYFVFSGKGGGAIDFVCTVKVNNVQASDGGNIINQCGTNITIGASGDTIALAS